MSRRLGLSLSMLAVGTALFVGAGLAGPAGGTVTRVDASTAAEARKGGTLRLSILSDVDSVDPALAYNLQVWPIEFVTCAKLFNHPDSAGSAGAQVIPEVVDTVMVSSDRRTYTFGLKTTFRFHTGAPVTARSFADAFNRDANPRMRSPAVAFLHEIVGVDAVIKGRARTISGVRVLGRHRLQIRLTRPLGDFIARLTMPFFCPILPNTAVDPTGIDKPAGSGPYYVHEWVANRRIVLKRNPYYHGNRPANVDQIVWTAGQSAASCIQAAERDLIDFCGYAVPHAAMTRNLVRKYGINRRSGQFFVSPALSTTYFAFNHDRPAFKGPGQIPLKKAINYAIDRPALARAFGFLSGTPTDQMLPPALGRDERIYSLERSDPVVAQRWLAKAKFKPTRLVLYANGSTSHGVAGARVFASNLKRIGIDVDVKYFDQAVLYERIGIRGEPFDVVWAGWVVDYADPAAYFEPLLNGKNLRAPETSTTRTSTTPE